MRIWSKSKKILSCFISSVLFCLPMSGAIAETNFSDIHQSYAKQTIEELVAKGIIKGQSNEQFNPAGTITRQDFSIILAKSLGLETSNLPNKPTFSDLPPEHYAYSWVEAAVQAELISGVGEGRFGVGDNLTREQMATFFVRALGVDATGKGASLSFSDADQISSWAKDSVAAAIELKLMQVALDNQFHPQGNTQREQVALVASRFLTIKDQYIEPKITSAEYVTNRSITLFFDRPVPSLSPQDMTIQTKATQEQMLVERVDISSDQKQATIYLSPLHVSTVYTLTYKGQTIEFSSPMNVQIQVTPTHPTVEVNQTLQFQAKEVDEQGNETTGGTYEWSTQDLNYADNQSKISHTGAFIASRASQYKVTAKSPSGAVGYTTVTVQYPVSSDSGDSSDDSPSPSPDALAVQKIREVLRKDYLYEPSEELLNQYSDPARLVKAVSEQSNDPYTTYLNPEEYAHFNRMMDGSFAGIGVNIATDPEGAKVVQVYEDSPASRAGILVDDVIIKVDHILLSTIPWELRPTLLQGQAGTEVSVVVRRSGAELPLSITRDKVKIPTVKVEVMEIQDKLMIYVRINRFTEETYDEFNTKFMDSMMETMETRNPEDLTGLVFDLRDNPGGLLSATTSILSWFIPNGEITSILEYRNKEPDHFLSTNLEPFPLPIIVMSNHNTASSAEIMTSTLQDYKMATIVGTRTFGKGVGQSDVKLPNGGGLFYTQFRLLTPVSKSDYHGVGIEPNLSLSSTDHDKWLDTVRLLLSGSLDPRLGDLCLSVGDKEFFIDSEFAKQPETWNLFKEVMTLVSGTSSVSIYTLAGFIDVESNMIPAIEGVYLAEISKTQTDYLSAMAAVETIEQEDIRNVLLSRLHAIPLTTPETETVSDSVYTE
ncbi:S41 family peptidase [Ammoniphilus sp. CFH 90114]|uniref:S41 family peptidase n=1 Tax=Ammoniphilus sp. CFH 90114 TaxID=2493665 RepID=UPI00100FA8B5|nr:S41 family peptidase [Ammoniphilus sp. CFH 90114]RXT03730.1 PDZ domain-containing protein [Ammoniphilus sp. CFH 90114]